MGHEREKGAKKIPRQGRGVRFGGRASPGWTVSIGWIFQTGIGSTGFHKNWTAVFRILDFLGFSDTGYLRQQCKDYTLRASGKQNSALILCAI